MDLKPIKNESDYQASLKEIEKLFTAEKYSPEWEKLDILTTLVEVYEQEHYPIDPPNAVEAILYYLESRNHGFADFINGLKSRGVSEAIIKEVLNDLTKKQVII
jgi:HTH-type transcriptional regulator/antitoxin HigA